MASTEELAQAFVMILQQTLSAPPMTLMNHSPDQAALVIAAVVDRCAELQLGLKRVSTGSELAEDLGLCDGTRLNHGERPNVHVDPALGRQLMFALT